MLDNSVQCPANAKQAPPHLPPPDRIPSQWLLTSALTNFFVCHGSQMCWRLPHPLNPETPS
jgi:hypothetical protein